MSAARDRLAELTPQHLRILELMCRGLTAVEIGKRLGIEEQTVANHKSRMYRRLGVNSGSAAVALGVQAGMRGPR